MKILHSVFLHACTLLYFTHKRTHVCLILHVIKGEYSFSFSKLGQVYSTVLLVIINLVEREEGEGREGKENWKPEVMVPS